MLTAENSIELCRYSAEDLTWRGSVVIDLPVQSGRSFVVGPGDELHISVDGGALYRIDLSSASAELAYQIPGVPSRATYYILDDERILMAGFSQYYGVYDIGSGTLDLRLAEVANPATRVFSILAHTSGDVLCSASLGVCLTRVDPDTGEAETLGLAHDGSGEIYGSAEANGKVYSISYTHAVLTAYDPTRPWEPGRDEHCNPHNLGPLGECQYRPVTGILNGPSGKLYVGTLPDYGARGGALTIIDPGDDTWQVFRHLVKDHSVTGLAGGPEHVYVGTTTEADNYISPAEGDACLLVFDPRECRVVHQRAVPGAHAVRAIGYAGDKIFFMMEDHTRSEWICVCDAELTAIRRLGHRWRYGDIVRRPMTSTADGKLLFGHLRGIVRIDPEAETLAVIWELAPGRKSEVYLAAYGRDVLFSVGNDLFRLKQP